MMLNGEWTGALDDLERADLITPCGLTRCQIFALPLREKVNGYQTSVEVALLVYPTSLVGALRWLELHAIRPVGRQFAGEHPGLLWPGHEVSAHADNAAHECPICRSAAQRGLRGVASRKAKGATAHSAA